MSRIFWQVFALAFSAVVGGCVWVVAHMLDTEPDLALLAGGLAFGGLEASMIRFVDRHTGRERPADRDPYTAADKVILNEAYVPRILRRPLAESLTPDDEDTAVFDGQFFNLKRPKVKPDAVVDEQTHILRADEVFGRQSRYRAGAR